MGLFGSIGKALKKFKPLRFLGKAAKFAAPFIPGIGPLAAAGIGAAGHVLDKGKRANLRGLAGGAAIGGLGKLGLNKLGGLGSVGQKTGLLGRLGKLTSRTGFLGKAFTLPEGGLDLQRIAGVGLGAANMLGAGAQRRSAERSNAATVALRNQLMSRILAQPQYNFNPEP